MEESKRQCKAETGSIEAQLQIVRGDSNVMEGVVKLTKCKTGLLLQCGDKLTIGHRAKLARLQSPEAQLALAQQGYGQTPDAKCTVSSSPDCVLLRDQFIDIQAAIQDKEDELEEQRAQMQ